MLKVRNTCDLATISVSFPTNDLHGLTAVQTSLPCAEDVLGGRKFVRVRGGIRTKKAHPNLATSQGVDMDNGNKHGNHGSGFAHLAAKASGYVGSSWAFTAALLSIVIWGLSGPYFRYSDTWQLIINTTTTVITFLIVFLIQNTQNRDARALHLKLDEVIRAIHGAHNDMINIERLSDRELEHLAKRYERFASEWTERRQARASENSEQN